MMYFETETEALAVEVGRDLEQLHPSVILETVKGWMPGLLSFGYKVLVALIIFAIGRKVIKMLQKMINRSFERAEMEISVRRFLNSMISAGFNGILIFIVAGKIGIDSASIIALLGSAGLAIGLAIQGSLANFAGGVLILLMKPFKIGDYIVTTAGEGTVSVIGLVYTTLITADNKTTVIPNGTLANSPLTNVTYESKRRLDIMVGIGYQSDLKKAKAIIGRIYMEHPSVLKDSSVDIFVDELADSCVRLGGRGWVKTEDYWITKWDITEKIKLEFDQAGIEIPFNQLDIHLKK